MPRNRSMTDSDWETAKVTRGMNMANNCGFEVNLYGKNIENMRRVCDIINDNDLVPEGRKSIFFLTGLPGYNFVAGCLVFILPFKTSNLHE